MKIKPIKNERDYRRTLKIAADLMDAKPHTTDGDHLDIFATLLDAWERKHHPIDSPDPVKAIEFVMDQRGLIRRDLEVYSGSRGRVAEVLNRKRPLTLPMIRTLHSGLGIAAEALIAVPL